MDRRCHEWGGWRYRWRRLDPPSLASRAAREDPLPNMWYEFSRPNHWIASLTPERRRKLRHVREWPIHAPLLRRVGVDSHARPQRRVTRVLAIALRVGNEEAPLRCEAVDRTWPSIPLQCAL